jgi:hypothetical protein
VLRNPDFWGSATYDAAEVEQVIGIEGLAALVALVSPGSGKVTAGAFAFQVTIGKIAIALRAICRRHFVSKYVSLVSEGEKYFPNHFGVVRGMGGGEKIEGNAQLLPGV